MQGGTGQTYAVQDFAALLFKGTKDMLNAGTGPGNATVSPFLVRGQRTILLGFALDVQTPAFAGQTGFTLLINVALIGSDVAGRIAQIEHRLEV
jgi:hypothetical protein